MADGSEIEKLIIFKPSLCAYLHKTLTKRGMQFSFNLLLLIFSIARKLRCWCCSFCTQFRIMKNSNFLVATEATAEAAAKKIYSGRICFLSPARVSNPAASQSFNLLLFSNCCVVLDCYKNTQVETFKNLNFFIQTLHRHPFIHSCL